MNKNTKMDSQVIGRLNRIVGQVQGVKKMIEQERDCSEIILQIAAIRAAVSQLGLIMVQNHMEECIERSIKKGNAKELAGALNKVMKQMLK